VNCMAISGIDRSSAVSRIIPLSLCFLVIIIIIEELIFFRYFS
jgi:hypothetical protein